MAQEAAPATPPAPKAAEGVPSVGTPPPPGPQPAAPGADWQSFFFMVVPMMVIFYFLFIRPENKRRQEKEKLMSGIKPKDKVVTIGGLHGTVVEIDGEEVTLLVDPKKDVRLKYRRSAIDTVEAAKEEKK